VSSKSGATRKKKAGSDADADADDGGFVADVGAGSDRGRTGTDVLRSEPPSPDVPSMPNALPVPPTTTGTAAVAHSPRVSSGGGGGGRPPSADTSPHANAALREQLEQQIRQGG